MVNIVWVNADYACDFHPLADHMTKLRNFSNIRLFLSPKLLQLLLLAVDLTVAIIHIVLARVITQSPRFSH